MSHSVFDNLMPTAYPEQILPASFDGDEELGGTTDFAALERAARRDILKSKEEIFYRKVINLSEEQGSIICESAGREGYYFTLISDTNDRYLNGDLGPNLFLKIPDGGSELVLKCPISAAHHVHDQVIQEFFATVFSHFPDDPQSVVLRTEIGILSPAQLELIAGFGFKEIKQGSYIYQPAEKSANPSDKQAELNDDLEAAQALFERYLSGETSGNKTHNEWCRSGNMLLQLALIVEAEHGLNAARELLEATRLQFVGAEKTLPEETWETAELDLLSEIEYAGTLARLAACENLRDYGQQQPGVADTINKRRQDLFASTIRMYENAEKRIPQDAPMELRFLVGSGKAHAYALHVKYENAGDSCPDTLASDNNPYFERAVFELEKLGDTIPPGLVSAKIQQQLSDTLSDWLGYEPAHGQVPIADVALRNLTEEVLA